MFWEDNFNEETIAMFWEMYYADEDREETPQQYLDNIYLDFIISETEYETIRRIL